MACIAALYLAKKYEIDVKTCQIRVSNKASALGGTTAELSTGDVLSLEDALYGMMLPSGNDAAQSIADFFHKFIYNKNKESNKSLITN